MKTEYKLENNKILGIRVISIQAIPYSKEEHYNIEDNILAQERIINEIYQLDNRDIALEILWLSKKSNKESKDSKLKIYFVLRMIKDNSEVLKKEFDVVIRNIINSLKMQNYELEEIDVNDSVFDKELESINDSKTYTLVKKENLIANQFMPYYYSEHLSTKSKENMNNLISAFIQSDGAALSFQLIPTFFTPVEKSGIQEYTEKLGMLSRGFYDGQMMVRDEMANKPKDYYDFYFNRLNSPKFLYNIVITGRGEDVGNISTKVISQLKAGNSSPSLEFNCLDISSSQYTIKKKFPNYVWNINAVLLNKYRNNKLGEKLPVVNRLRRLPYIVSGDEAVSFFRVPYGDDNTVGININRRDLSTEEFSDKIFDEDNIKIGKLKNTIKSNTVDIGCPPKSFTKHALIVGMPGSGKTTMSVNLLLQFAERGIPFLAIEPTKMEYRAMIDAIDDLQIFTPGNSKVSPFIVNPFIPPKGISVEKYIPSLADAFKAAFSMPSPLDMIFLKAIKSTYVKYGWKEYSTIEDDGVTVFGMYEFIKEFKTIVQNSDYGKEIKGNLESAGTLRLLNLIEQNSNIYDNINTIPIEDLISKPTVIELNSIENQEQKTLIMALLLINICIYTKNRQVGDGKLKNVLLIDEAHVLLNPKSDNAEGKVDPGASTVKAMQNMIVEIRSYGTSIIIADQAPSKVTREVVGNTDIKVAFRLVQSIEKEMIGDSTNMSTDEINSLSGLKPGEAYIHYSELEKAQLVQTNDIRAEKGIRLAVSDEEVKERMVYWNHHKELLIPYRECSMSAHKCSECDYKVKADADYYAHLLYTEYEKQIIEKEHLAKMVVNIGTLLKKKYPDFDFENKQLMRCIKIKLIRITLLNKNFIFTDKDIERIVDYSHE